MKSVHRLLHHAVGIGDALMLAQMLHPRFDQKRFERYGPLRRRPRTRPRHRRRRAAARCSSLAMALRKAARSCGRMRYSTVTSTGPRSCSMSCAVSGAGQCMDGVRSTPAPVCSFHRQVRGMAATAPAAARKCAVGSPTQTATSPQTALPSVRQPKNTVVYRASPRPRTQSGSATCADTLSVASAAIHDAPAISAGDERRRRLAGEAVEHHRHGLAQRAQRHQPIGPELRLQPGQQKRAADGAGADDAEQHAVEPRTARDLLARDQRQQRPIGAGEQEKSGRPHHRRAQMRIMSGIAKAGRDGLAEPLRRQQRSPALSPRATTARRRRCRDWRWR